MWLAGSALFACSSSLRNRSFSISAICSLFSIPPSCLWTSSWIASAGIEDELEPGCGGGSSLLGGDLNTKLSPPGGEECLETVPANGLGNKGSPCPPRVR